MNHQNGGACGLSVMGATSAAGWWSDPVSMVQRSLLSFRHTGIGSSPCSLATCLGSPFNVPVILQKGHWARSFCKPLRCIVQVLFK